MKGKRMNTQNEHLRILSIRLTGCGFSFRIDGPKESRTGTAAWRETPGTDALSGLLSDRGLTEGTWDAVYVFFDTLRCVLVPEPYFDDAQTDNYLKANGFESVGNETVIASPAAGGIRAVMLADADLTAGFEQAFGKTVQYYSLLQVVAAGSGGDAIRILLSGENAYAAVFAGGLQLAEALPAASEADIVYYVHRLRELFPAKKLPVWISGDGEERVAKTLKRYFRSVKAEDADAAAERFIRQAQNPVR